MLRAIRKQISERKKEQEQLKEQQTDDNESVDSGAYLKLFEEYVGKNNKGSQTNSSNRG